MLGNDVGSGQVRTITRQYRVAPIFYTVALAVAFISALASFVTILSRRSILRHHSHTQLVVLTQKELSNL